VTRSNTAAPAPVRVAIITPERLPDGGLGLVPPWRALWASRHVIAELGRRQVRVRHRGSFLGVLWTLVHPLLLLGVYTLVFTVLLPYGVEPGRRAAFVLELFCGLVVFGVFAETVQRAPTAVWSNPNFVKKAVFPLEALPVADLWASAFAGAVNFLVLMAASWFVAGPWPASALWLPAFVPPLLLATAGVAWIVAALGVYVRDLAVSIGVLVTALFFLTPIVYRLDQVPATWRPLLELNPLAGLVDGVRTVLFAGSPPDPGGLALAWLLAALLAHVGLVAFRAARRGFADVL